MLTCDGACGSAGQRQLAPVEPRILIQLTQALRGVVQHIDDHEVQERDGNCETRLVCAYTNRSLMRSDTVLLALCNLGVRKPI